nr:MAG TPA: hypothetical protein [Caudoviricetes sp.]
MGQRRIRCDIYGNYNCFRTAFCVKYAKVYSGIGCASKAANFRHCRA